MGGALIMKKNEIYDPVDILLAYKHSSKYAKDYENYLKEYSAWVAKEEAPDKIEIRVFDAIFTLSKPAIKLCRKYHIRYPIDPNAPPDDHEYSYISAPIKYLIPMELIRQFDQFPEQKKIAEIIISFLENRLVLLVDTSVPRKKITKYFNNLIEKWTAESHRGIAAEDEIELVSHRPGAEQIQLAEGNHVAQFLIGAHVAGIRVLALPEPAFHQVPQAVQDRVHLPDSRHQHRVIIHHHILCGNAPPVRQQGQ